jgi:hypothetical protein
MGKAFLASIKLRPPPTEWVARADILDGLVVHMPAGAWENGARVNSGGRLSLFELPHEQVALGFSEYPPSPGCAAMRALDDAGVVAELRQQYGDDFKLGKATKVGPDELYAELTDADVGTLVISQICLDPRVLHVSVIGRQPATELQPILERVTHKLQL